MGTDSGPQSDDADSETAAALTGSAAPDLIESVVGDPPSSAVIGGTFTASDTVKNQGSADAGASYTKYYLGSGTVPQYLLGNRSVGAIGSGATDAGSGPATIPAGVPQGSYKLIACADSGSGTGGRISQVAESNENNNCAPSAGLVAVDGPDLTESNVSVSPSTITAATGTLTVSDQVNNGGGASAGASVTRWYLSTDSVKDPNDAAIRNCTNGNATPGRNVAGISPGGNNAGSASTSPVCVRDVNGLHPPASGTYFVIACADNTNLVGELNESNNCTASTNTVQFQGGVDLQETAVGNPSITSGQVGSQFTITDTAENFGGDPAPSTFTKFYLSTNGTTLGAWLGVRTVGALSPLQTDSATTTLTIQAGTASGTYKVVACADSGPGTAARTSQVSETNENNNCRASVGTIAIGSADLLITAMSSPPPTGTVGTQFTVTGTTKNQGATDSPSFYNKYYLSLNGTQGVYLLAPGAFAPALTAGSSEDVSATATIPSGTAPNTYWVLGCADAGPGTSGKFSQVAETNENNNCTKSPTQIIIN